jgi:hypothetical protein
MNKGTEAVAEHLAVMSKLARALKLGFVKILDSDSEKEHLDTFARTIHVLNLVAQLVCIVIPASYLRSILTILIVLAMATMSKW